MWPRVIFDYLVDRVEHEGPALLSGGDFSDISSLFELAAEEPL